MTVRPLAFDKQSAYVLHRKAYQENAQMVQFLTLEYGRITVIVRQSSKMIGKTLQPFIPMLLSCAKGQEIFVLREVDLQEKGLLKQVKLKMLGMYINELIIKMVPRNIASASLFHLYTKTLIDLKREDGHESILRRFEMGLLTASGHGMQLDYDAKTHADIDRQSCYVYEPGTGPLLEQSAHSQQVRQLPVCYGKTLLALKDGLYHYDQQILDESRKLMRIIINYHLKGKEMHTRSIFQYLKGLN